MRLSYRKPITYLSEEHIEVLLSNHFGKKEHGHSFIGFGIGPGWSEIVYDLHKKLERENPDYVIHQVKEKFGTLRYYVGKMTDQGHIYIAEAENLSAVTCEECGRPGKIWGSKGWIRTLCWIDYRISEINKSLWILQRRGLQMFFKNYFYVRRLRRNMKRKKSAEN
jgi:hypothetical protein